MNSEKILKKVAEIMDENPDASAEDAMNMLSFLFGGSSLSIAALKETHSQLCKILAPINLSSAVPLIAALETIPNLQKYGVRLSVLLHLALVSCRGEQEPTISDLDQWIHLIRESPTCVQEDPPEDVFVGYVCSPAGGFRVFPGLISNADFIVERLLTFLHKKREFPTFADGHDSVVELLKLSEAIANSLALPRYFTRVDHTDNDLPSPDQAQIETHTKAVTFNDATLIDLGIDKNKLTPFILDPSKVEQINNENVFGSSIEVFPLINFDDILVIAAPSILCRAAAIRILDVVRNLGGWADTFFEIESAEYFINKVIPHLGIKPNRITLPKPASDVPRLYPYAGQFDFGMPTLVLTQTSPLSQGSNIEDLETLSDQQIDGFTQYLSDCCECLEQVEGFKGGIIIFALSGVGRPMATALKELRPNWHFYSAPLADWKTLATEHDFTTRRLWYLAQQEEMAESAKIQFVNMAGLLNLYGFWKRRRFALLPADMDPKQPNKMLMLSSDCAQQVNLENKNTSDRHCVWHPIELKWLEVERDGAGLNPDVRSNLKYCDHESTVNGVLRGCVSIEKFAWWIEVRDRPKSSKASGHVFKLWECVQRWSERILLIMSKDYGHLIPREAVILLQFPAAEDWNLDSISEQEDRDMQLICDIHPAKNLISLTISEYFLSEFFQPKNSAERKIVTALVRALAENNGKVFLENEEQECVQRIVKNHDTRFFHILRSSDLEAVMATGRAEPMLIPEEEFERVGIGLAYTASNAPAKIITDRKEAQKFLEKIVRGIQGRLSAKLKDLWILPVVSHCFSQLDELSRDSSRWNFSIRSLLALEENAEWLQDHLRNSGGRIAQAEIANRALIETAAYSCDPSSRVVVSQTEHLSMLADIAVMLQIAGYRDAITNGLVEPEIKIHLNGQIEFDDGFREKVMKPYLTSRVDDNIRRAAELYDDHFSKEVIDAPPASEQNSEAERFESAFFAEFGFYSDSLTKVTEVFAEFAKRSSQSGGTLEDLQLRQLLINRATLSKHQTEAFLERFVLPMRPAWDKEFPTGCEPNDVFPWRFFRGLSVLIRPFVEVSKSPKQYAISATHLQRWRSYFIHSLLNGDLPDRIFRSVEMKSYLGGLTKKRGERFEKKVADEMRKILPEVRHSVKMRELGKADASPSDDVDVVAWDLNSGRVYLLECKSLKRALTASQVIQQLESFRGDPENTDDYLAKHVRRVEWLKANSDGVTRLTGISAANIQWTPILVSDGRVPMSHFEMSAVPRDQIIAYADLRPLIRDQLFPA
ncbi:MAG: hypothetical protein KF712_17635 [Akkermansiaceae bacterium]|nr:hypothetical protein [Akkermansiaceae bacterium]